MKQDFLQSVHGQKLQRRYGELQEELVALGWLTHGSVTPNHPGHWRWTTKVKSKTITLALTQEQAEIFKDAIINHRKLDRIVHEMRAISLQVLLKSTAGIPKKSGSKNHPKSRLT